MNKKKALLTSLKILVVLSIAVWGILGSYRVITTEIMNYSIFNQNGTTPLVELADHTNDQEGSAAEGSVIVGRGRGGVGRGGGNGGGGHNFTVAPDAFSRYMNYIAMFALIILIVYWIQKYTGYRKKAKKQVLAACS